MFNKTKRTTALILILAIIIPLIPIGEINVFAEGETIVKAVSIYRTYKGATNESNTIHIRGSNLPSGIGYMLHGGDTYIDLSRTIPGSGSDKNYRQYRVEDIKAITSIKVGNYIFDITETDMPKVEKVAPNEVNMTSPYPQLKLTGVNFLNFSTMATGSTSATIANKDITNKFFSDTETYLYEEDLKQFGYGNQDLVIKQTKKQDGADINIIYNQNNLFRIYETIDLDINNDVVIYPNRGKRGSKTSVTIGGHKENFSVFFLEEETSRFKYENMGESPEYQNTLGENRTIVDVKVPSKLTIGTTYKVFITNNLDNEYQDSKVGDDLSSKITKQKYIGDFYVVDAGADAFIDRTYPESGTSAGSPVTIYGYRLEELKIPGITGETSIKSREIISGDIDSPSILRITYHTENIKYRTKTIESISRDFLVTIGRDAIFQPGDINKNIFRPGDDKVDELYVRTRTIDNVDLKQAKKEVVVSITTTIKTQDGLLPPFTEQPSYFGYTFLPSYEDPTIDDLVPNKIEVTGNESPKTKSDIILSIIGQDFTVYRYSDGGEIKTNYPKIIIGGSNEENGEIIIEKSSDGKVRYKTKDGEITEEGPDKSIFEVLTATGTIVNGIGDNIKGSSIAIKIPKNLNISSLGINKPLSIAMVNPKRDSGDKGTIYMIKTDIIEFVTPQASPPTIENINKQIVTIEGGETITISGRGFQEGIEVYIAGKKVEGVTKNIDKQSTRGVLEFKAPKGKEGTTILQIMNPDGGSDTRTFIYVESEYMDPKITRISPPEGTKDDIIIIKGSNFLKADPTVQSLQGINMSKLIGTRVFLGGQEVNSYVEGGGLERYKPPTIEWEDLIVSEKDPFTREYELKTSSHLKAAIIEDADLNSFDIRRNRYGEINLIGKEKTYIFYNEEEVIKATDGTIDYTVDQSSGKLYLRTPELSLAFTVGYNYQLFSVGKNQEGKEILRVSDYYPSLILEEEGKYYKILKDELGKISITDEGENIYQVKINDGALVATRGSNSYPITSVENGIKFNNKIFELKTPYYVDPLTKVIIGHRVSVKTSEEIEVRIPEKQIPGFYDVKVENPDTKDHTVVRGFKYNKPQIKPAIFHIDPNEGSIDGGYYINIHGENFGENPQVRINGELVGVKDTQVNKEDYKSIKVRVPKYIGNIEEDFITDRKSVRVHVTAGGASTSRDDLFAYRIAASSPEIKIHPGEGSMGGGKLVEIEGRDFRFFEPFWGEVPKPGDENFDDLDGNGVWTNYISEVDLEGIAFNDPTIEDYTHYVDSPVLPSVYFGSRKARIVEFENLSGDSYKMKVITPPGEKDGTVQVYLRNNDSGQSKSVNYIYKKSNPSIKEVNPKRESRKGGNLVDLVTEAYEGNRIKLIDPQGVEKETTHYLVRFGDLTNKDIGREADNGGLIKKSKAQVVLKGGLKVDLNNNNLTISLEESDKEYIGQYQLAREKKYIDLKSLKEVDEDTNYKGFEILKVEVNDGRLIVERGYSPLVIERIKGVLEVTTPSYYKNEEVSITLVNPGGESNKVGFTYLNPSSSPKIRNITRDGEGPDSGDGGRARVVTINIKGGQKIRVYGEDFRPDASISIGSQFLTIKPEYISENELYFQMPENLSENQTDKWHPLIVKNPDGGNGRSDQSQPTPIYIEIVEGVTDPQVSGIKPNKGPASGGTKVFITGVDFRYEMEDFANKKLKVYFGEVEGQQEKVLSHDKIEVIAPLSKTPGQVDVKIQNPDGTPSQNGMMFTYISKPTIKKIDPNKIFSNDLDKEISISGTQFLDGARLILAGQILAKKDLKEDMEVRGQGIRGVDADGNNIEVVVVGGIEIENINIESPESIKFKLGKELDLESTDLIIINPDGGISDPYKDFSHEKPLPLRPLVLEAIPGYESTIQLIWSKSSEDILNKATSYEIYGRLSKEKESTFIASTDSPDYLVKNLKADTEYVFMVRALNKYGAALDFATVKVKTLNKRQDEKLKEKEEKLKKEEEKIKTQGKEETRDGRLYISLGTDHFKRGAATLDLSLSKYKNTEKITIAIPLELARKDNILTVKDNTLTSTINVRDMYSLGVSKKDKGDRDAFLRIHIDKSREEHLPRNKKAISYAYEIYFDYVYGKDKLEIDNLLRSGKIFMEADKLLNPRNKQVDLYEFLDITGQYRKKNTNSLDIKARTKVILLSDK